MVDCQSDNPECPTDSPLMCLLAVVLSIVVTVIGPFELSVGQLLGRTVGLSDGQCLGNCGRVYESTLVLT